jgi:hypothetical protein
LARQCPACGERLHLRLRDAFPRTIEGPDLACPSCGTELAYPTWQKAAWHLGQYAAIFVLVLALAHAGSLFRRHWSFAFLLAMGVLLAATFAFLPFWRVREYVPAQPRGVAVNLSLLAATYGLGLALAWLLWRLVLVHVAF